MPCLQRTVQWTSRPAERGRSASMNRLATNTQTQAQTQPPSALAVLECHDLSEWSSGGGQLDTNANVFLRVYCNLIC